MFLVILFFCVLKWVVYIKRNGIKIKYFMTSIISIIIYWIIIGLIVYFDKKISVLVFGGLSVVFYFVSLIISFKRGCFFLEVMDKHYPHLMYKFNMSNEKDKNKKFENELVKIKKNCTPIVLEAIVQRELIKSIVALHIEVLLITLAFLWPERFW